MPDPTINDAINAIMQNRAQSRGLLPAHGSYGSPTDQAQFAQALKQAQQQYPWVRNLGVPIKMFKDIGPYWSESYDPKEGRSPFPGQFSIGLRSEKAMDPQTWPGLIGRESIDYMARHDPQYQAVANKFIEQMKNNPKQLAIARKRHAGEVGNDIGANYSFDDWLHEAEAQEWIGAYLTNMPHWKNMPYSPEQRKMLDAYKQKFWAGQKQVPLNLD